MQMRSIELLLPTIRDSIQYVLCTGLAESSVVSLAPIPTRGGTVLVHGVYSLMVRRMIVAHVMMVRFHLDTHENNCLSWLLRL